ncbi:P-loop containing nucleoside triphosphate hydrolase protein [Biscogniauxia mediterranea]|nr:P-loop containing nucleoside triphosphate hydrolase protein [Biscogniauxia mediterranea]
MEENMNHHQTSQTRMRAPTKLPQFTSSVGHGFTQSQSVGLQEISDSQSNARAQPSLAGSNAGLKRGLPAPVSQPDAKRKNLVERAGSEFPAKLGGPLGATSTRNIKGATLKDLNRPYGPNSNGGGFTGPRHITSNSYASTNNYATSVGPGGRPPSRSHTRARSTTRIGRPATSLGTRDEGHHHKSDSTSNSATVNNNNNVTDIDERVGRMDSELQKVREFMESTEKNNASVKEELEAAKKRAALLEDERNELRSEKARLKDKLDDTERQVRNLDFDLQQERRRHERVCKEMEDDHRRILANKEIDFNREMGKLEKLQQEFEEKCGAEAEARLENLSNENKELRHSLERQKRDHEHDIQLLNDDIHKRESELRKAEEDLKKAAHERKDLELHIRGHVETIDRLRKRAEDAEERLAKDQGHLGSQIQYLSSTLDNKSERIQSLEEEAKALQAKFEQEIENIKLAAQKQIAEETDSLRIKLIKEEERRHRLFEQVQELKGNIRVMCRIKPPSDREKDALIKFNPRVNELDEDKIDGLSIPTEREDFRMPGKMIPGKPKEFNFERVFDDRCTNGDVFDEISQLVQSVMDGKKVCIFCYGQTGSGKTYTMSKRAGDNDDGIIPRTQSMIFGEVERLKALGWEYTVEGSYLEVYQDKLYDLLASRHSKPEPLMVDPIGDELNIKGHDFTLLHDERDLDNMVKTADNNRHVAATAKNDRSSRSHSILVLKIHGVKKNEAGEVIKTRKGTLNLIDLAGSETPDKNGHPQVYKEGVEINSSLSYLRTVLANLGQGKTEGVDFRSYTLTQLLRPSLGKGCRTLMFVMVSPLKENENETVRSLEFARDAQKVKMGGNGGSKTRK